MLIKLDLSDNSLKSLVQDYKKIVKSKTGKNFPQNPKDQLFSAINAVFLSWNNDRAIFYRKHFNHCFLMPLFYFLALIIYGFIFEIIYWKYSLHLFYDM